MNASLEDPCLLCPFFTLSSIFGVVFSVIVITGVCGNVFVATVILNDRKLRSSSINLFLLNLALADLGNLVACCPDITLFLYGGGWLLPDFLCPVLRFFEEYFLYASVLMQMSIGIERFMAICTPMRLQRFSRRTSWVVILSVWVIAALFASPYMMFHRTSFSRYGVNRCLWSDSLSPSNRLLFKYTERVVLYVLPLILLTVLYTIMGSVLWGNSQNIADEGQQAAILRLRRSVVKMLIISMLLYFICYSPIQGIFVTQTILKKDVHINPALKLTLNALSFSSSSANPIVYIVCCRHFRSRFLETLRFFYAFLPDSRRYSSVTMQTEDTTIRCVTRSPYVSFRKPPRHSRFHPSTLV